MEEDVLNPGPQATSAQRDFYSRALTSYRGGALKKGARGKTVRALQLFLRDQGQDIKADGVMGPETQAALKAWQADEGLSSDGVAGQREVFTRIRETVTPRPRTRPTPPPPPSPIDSVPPGVGINDAAFSAAKQDMSVGAAATSAAPGIMADSYPVGAGGARPDPTRRPVDRSQVALAGDMSAAMGGPPSRVGDMSAAMGNAPPPSPYDDVSRRFDDMPPQVKAQESWEREQRLRPPPPSYPVPPFSGPPEAEVALEPGRMDDAAGMEPRMPATAGQAGGLPPLNRSGGEAWGESYEDDPTLLTDMGVYDRAPTPGPLPARLSMDAMPARDASTTMAANSPSVQTFEQPIGAPRLERPTGDASSYETWGVPWDPLPQGRDPSALIALFQRLMQGDVPPEMAEGEPAPRDNEALMRALMAQNGGY